MLLTLASNTRAFRVFLLVLLQLYAVTPLPLFLILQFPYTVIVDYPYVWDLFYFFDDVCQPPSVVCLNTLPCFKGVSVPVGDWATCTGSVVSGKFACLKAAKLRLYVIDLLPFPTPLLGAGLTDDCPPI